MRLEKSRIVSLHLKACYFNHWLALHLCVSPQSRGSLPHMCKHTPCRPHRTALSPHRPTLPCRESGSRGGTAVAAASAGSSVEASLLSEEEYLLLTGRLHSVLRPFMMRRLLEAVATELPGKVGGWVCLGWILRGKVGGCHTVSLVVFLGLSG